MKTTHRDATGLPNVDIELPMLAQPAAIEPLLHVGDHGIRVGSPCAKTTLAVLDDRLRYVADMPPANLGDVAAHPARLRIATPEMPDAGHRHLSLSRAIRTGRVGLGELAACGQ